MQTITQIQSGTIESTGIKSTLKVLLYTVTGAALTAMFAFIYQYNFGVYEALAMAIIPPVLVAVEKFFFSYSIIVTDPSSVQSASQANTSPAASQSGLPTV